MKSGGRLGSPENNDVIICLSDDEDGGRAGVPAGDSTPSTSAGGELQIPSDNVVVTPSSTSSSRKEARELSSPSIAAANRGVGVPGPTSNTTPSASILTGGTSRGHELANGNGTTAANEKRRTQARKRSSFVQTLLSTPGCVLVIDNLELDVQPVDVLGQLMKFNNNKERIHSVHIPPPYPELNHAVGYVVFLNTESADLAAVFLTRNFVVSAQGRPWIVTRCMQKLNEEDFGFPTLSAFKGDIQDTNGDLLGGMKIVTDKQEAEYNATKKRRIVFEQHRKQAQLMFERHAQEEKDLEENPELNLYHY